MVTSSRADSRTFDGTATAPAPREASQASSAKLEELPGQLVCKTSNRDLGVHELRLEWNGNEAHGTIRTIAPSGETTVQRVTAEKYRGMIVVERTFFRDLDTPCREYRRTVAPRGVQARTIKGIGCRIGSGVWDLD